MKRPQRNYHWSLNRGPRFGCTSLRFSGVTQTRAVFSTSRYRRHPFRDGGRALQHAAQQKADRKYQQASQPRPCAIRRYIRAPALSSSQKPQTDKNPLFHEPLHIARIQSTDAVVERQHLVTMTDSLERIQNGIHHQRQGVRSGRQSRHRPDHPRQISFL